MNRDISGHEATRDPIFLLQVGTRRWSELPDGLQFDDDYNLVVGDACELADWLKPFVDDEGCVDCSDAFWKIAESLEGSSWFPMVYTEWRTESVFLTRDEGERWAQARSYRWEKWKVYCIPCDGELARILNEYQPAEQVIE